MPNETYQIELEDFCEDIFHEMERIQDGTRGHYGKSRGTANMIEEATSRGLKICVYRIDQK